MQQLDCRAYSRQEISEITSVNPKDSKHFARNIKATLDKWGYEYIYSSQSVQITRKPETAEERLKEILIRKLEMDVQINAYAFSCFICAFTDIDGYVSMPWAEREAQLFYKYGVQISERTLRSWCHKLIGQEVIQKSGRQSFWKTEILDHQKMREMVAADDSEMGDYFQRKTELLFEEKQSALAAGLAGKEARNKAWKNTMKRLWQEFECCYYSCGGFWLNAIDSTGADDLYEIYELTQEIAAKEKISLPEGPKTKEEFDEQWFRQKHL